MFPPTSFFFNCFSPPPHPLHRDSPSLASAGDEEVALVIWRRGVRGISGVEVSVSQSAWAALLKHTKRPARQRKWSLETSSSALHHGSDRPLNGGGGGGGDARRDRVAEKTSTAMKIKRLILPLLGCSCRFNLAVLSLALQRCRGIQVWVFYFFFFPASFSCSAIREQTPLLKKKTPLKE